MDGPSIVRAWLERRRDDAAQALTTARDLLPLARSGELYRSAPLAATPEQMQHNLERSEKEMRSAAAALAHLDTGGTIAQETAEGALASLRRHRDHWAGIVWEDVAEDVHDGGGTEDEAQAEYRNAHESADVVARRVEALEEWMVSVGLTVPDSTV
jgi:hypothetical protein